jgi:hypothetical protein
MDKFSEEAKLKIGDKVWVMMPELIKVGNTYTNDNRNVPVQGEVVHIQSNEIGKTLQEYVKKCEEIQKKQYTSTLSADELLYSRSVPSLLRTLVTDISADDDYDDDGGEGFINYTILVKCMILSAYQLNNSGNKQTHMMRTITLPQSYLDETFVKEDDKAKLQKKCDELNKLNDLQAKASRTRSAYY